MGKKDKIVEDEAIKAEKKKKKKDKSEAVEVEDSDKAAKKAKKEKKKAAAAAAAAEEATAEAAKAEKKKAKKEKKAKREDGAEDEPAAKKVKTEEVKTEEPAAAEDGAGRVYLGNLPWSVTEDQIKELFAKSGTISNIEWLTHQDTGKFKGAVFCQFGSAAEAQAATGLNQQDLDGRPMKVEIATPKKAPSSTTGQNLNEPGVPGPSLFLGNLPWSCDEEAVRKVFADCGGEITRVKWIEKDGEFKGMAFVDFDTVEAATKGVEHNGEDFMGRAMRINFAKPREPRPDAAGSAGRPARTYTPQGEKPEGCVELFCGNLPYSIDDDKIGAFFKSAGTVTGTRWLNDKETGEFKGIGFVSFDTTEEVDKAVELAGKMIDGRQVRIDYAGQKKKEPWSGGGSW